MVYIDKIPIADHGFYLNLDKDIDRKKFFEAQLNTYNITGVHRYPGINRNGRSGSRDSHIKMLESIVENRYEYTFIFEDDAKITSNFNTDYFTDIIFKFKQDKSLDIIWFGSKIESSYFYNETFNLISYRSAALGLLITLEGAKKVLSNTKPVIERQANRVCDLIISDADTVYNASIYRNRSTLAKVANASSLECIKQMYTRQVFGDKALLCEEESFRSNNSNRVLNGDRRLCINYIKGWDVKFKKVRQ